MVTPLHAWTIQRMHLNALSIGCFIVFRIVAIAVIGINSMIRANCILCSSLLCSTEPFY